MLYMSIRQSRPIQVGSRGENKQLGYVTKTIMLGVTIHYLPLLTVE